MLLCFVFFFCVGCCNSAVFCWCHVSPLRVAVAMYCILLCRGVWFRLFYRTLFCYDILLFVVMRCVDVYVFVVCCGLLRVVLCLLSFLGCSCLSLRVCCSWLWLTVVCCDVLCCLRLCCFVYCC